jgi:proteic killer suppression protein
VDIVFARKLRKCMNSASARQREFGDLANVIGRRLDDLAAIQNLNEAHALPGRFEALSSERKGQFSLRLTGNMRMILEPANEPIPTKEDGGIDLSKVTAICVTEIGDYH